ncbi:peptidoglycan DD-metalloendopeptidase family protein [Gilvimarinus sp. DA14]|uniref:peptidoglycan DD-metalloendopeptidase family protein n=1 Tax=Gilvimarinus sp. DA14 TaxID=2956798 RepID=UPI0020B73349|nr:peptidoglycan DD-metalloendopeptidase family protein [Gilvimarinus sp. DA14]UTF60139.1 peptidoglycan DD-metalloendopeptidase family protein [Gilvimarinus sp. DA14]
MLTVRWRTRWHPIRLFIILNMLFLAACSSAPPAQVADRQQPPTRKILVHTVAPNETLYSIAWRYGLDFRQLARHNGIGPPYTIYASQQLRLDVDDASKRKPPPAIAVRQPAPEPVRTTAVKSPSRPAPATPAKAPRSENKTPSVSDNTPPPMLTGPVKWQWPARGRVIAGFSSSSGLNKGIDIGGKLGEPVVAAADGHVVYAGTGLRGYGKLVIVKHNETFLSAYAHNRALQVKEGESVKGGQQIAELGSSGTDKEKLHFEIRREGKPVNPLTYLPKR